MDHSLATPLAGGPLDIEHRRPQVQLTGTTKAS
jgi:hypothetical protein